MRALLPLILVPLVLAGCLGLGGPERGGWSVFTGGVGCRDCERLIFSEGPGHFEIERTFEVAQAHRIFGWYESPVEAGKRFVLTWSAPAIPEIETRTAADEGFETHSHVCVADAAPAPTGPTATPTGPWPARRCVWEYTPTETLEAPDNGISIMWEVENNGGHTTVSFSAKRDP